MMRFIVSAQYSASTILRRLRIAVALLLVANVLGCGGQSAEDKMMQMARARSAANKAIKAEQEAREKQKMAANQKVANQTNETDIATPEKNVTVAVDDTAEAVEPKSVTEQVRQVDADAVDQNDAEAVLVSRKGETRPASNVEKRQTAISRRFAGGDDDARPIRGRSAGITDDATETASATSVHVSRSGEIAIYQGHDSVVSVCDTASGSVKRRFYIDGFEPNALTYCDEQQLVAMGGTDGSVQTFRSHVLDGVDVFQQTNILRREQDQGFVAHTNPIVAIAIRSTDGSVITCDTSGQIRVWSDKQSVFAVDSGYSDVKYLAFAAGDHVAVGTESGGIQLWNISASDQEPVTLSGTPDGKLLDMSLSKNGRRLAAVFGDKDRQSLVWELGIPIEAKSTAEPIVTIQSKSPNSSGSIDPAGTHLLIGNTDGTSNLWAIDDGIQIARFERHARPVIGLGISDDRIHVVSVDQSMVMQGWHFPHAVDPSDKRVPSGKSRISVRLDQLLAGMPVPAITPASAVDLVRQQLIDNATDIIDGAIFDLFPADESTREAAKGDLTLLTRMKDFVRRAGTATSQQLAAIGRTKRGFFDKRRLLTEQSVNVDQQSFSDRHKNLVFTAETNYDFQATSYRPVKLTIAKDRYVYAARRSPQVARSLQAGRGQSFTRGQPGARGTQNRGSLSSWDFGYSGIKTHDWNDIGIDVEELYASPDGRAVFTVPDLFVFSHDGHSRPIASGAKWAVSRSDSASSDYLFAVGTQGSVRREEVIFRVYDGKKLLIDSESPLGEFSAYEGVVTAIAFAKQHRQIAFCVRERASYRLYLADPTNLDPSTFLLIDEQPFGEPYLLEADDAERNQRVAGPPGITSLEFSPDDDLLVAHGLYEKKKFRLSMWQLDWAQDGGFRSPGRSSTAPSNGFVRVQKTYDPWIPERGPVLEDHGSKSIHFIHRKADKRDVASDGPRLGGSSISSGDVVVIESRYGLQVINLRTRNVLREVPFAATQWGRPEYYITDDGRWVIMGDDNGTIDIVDLIDGERISLTADGRPAHAGPVVGVTLSDPDPVLGFPAYAATVGEENRLKVWDLILPMTTPEASTTLPKPKVVVRQKSRRKR